MASKRPISRGFAGFRVGYAEDMFRLSRKVAFLVCVAECAFAGEARAQVAAPLWTFAVSGDSRNCGDFVMPAIAARVKGENDTFYWHLGDFRWMSQPDEDLLAMRPAGSPLTLANYQQMA